MLGEHLVAGEQVLGPDNDLQALEELSRTISSESQRSASRRALNSPVVIRHGNASRRRDSIDEGKLRDLSDSGCRLLTSIPLMVGDIYWLEINSAESGASRLLGRCVRCRMLGEASFEQGFSFFSSPSRAESPEASDNPLF